MLGMRKRMGQDSDDDERRRKKRREEAKVVESPESIANTNKEILEAIKEQNKALRTLNETLQRQTALMNSSIQNQNAILAAMDSKLEGQSAILTRINSKLETREKDKKWTPPSELVAGSWKFQESEAAQRNRESHKCRHDAQVKGARERYPWNQYESPLGPLTVFGNVSPDPANESVLSGGFYEGSLMMTRRGGFPAWYDACNMNRLPELVFNNHKNLNHKSGMYRLVIKYSKGKDDEKETQNYDLQHKEAAIIIGGVEFNSNGSICAEGADWDRLLLNGERQRQIPYAHGARGEAKWLRRKLSEPWVDGDVLEFGIDTTENTLTFKRGDFPPKLLWNVLAYTNHRHSPDSLHAYAFCGGYYKWSSSSDKAKLTDPPKLTIMI